MQELRKKRPIYVATDPDQTLIDENGSPYIKNLRTDYNKNEPLPTGTRGDGPQGANMGSGTPLQGSLPVLTEVQLPEGKNQTIGTYECQETNEIYFANYNSNGQHGIYRINGFTSQVDKVYINACLGFSIHPQHTINNRFFLKVIYGLDAAGNRVPMAKYLLFTDGNGWQRWIDVETAIATDGYDPVAYPYFKMPAPFGDQCMLINWGTAPPMVCPLTELVPFTQADVGKYNHIERKSLQFAYQYLYRDGRQSTFSPYSANVLSGVSGCSQLATNAPRCVKLTLDAGGPLVEKIRIFFRNCNGDWYVYETINKYEECTEGPFYERTVDLAGYDPVTNRFEYLFCGDKECGLYNAEDALRVQNDLPIRSYALTPVGDSVLLCNNLYGYDNFSCGTLDHLSAKAVQNATDSTAGCVPKNVKIVCWVVSGGAPVVRLDGPDGPVIMGYWVPTGVGAPGFISYSRNVEAEFANDVGFAGYLAGTDYATIGEQYKVNADGTMEKVGVLNFYDDQVRQSIFNHMANLGGYYATRFEFNVPAGNYLFRVMSNKALLTDPNYAATSTYIAYKGNVEGMVVRNGLRYWTVNNKDYTHKELQIDACGGDVDTWEMNKLVLDTEIPELLGITREKAIVGYLRDTRDADSVGLEGYGYTVNEGFPETIRSGKYTDHNGFYFISVSRGGGNKADVIFWGEFNCQVYPDGFHPIPGLRTFQGTRPRGQWFFQIDLYLSDVPHVNLACNAVKVLGKITDENGAPLAGVSVTVTRGNSVLTNSDGEFTLKVHKGIVRGGGPGNPDYLVVGTGTACPLVSPDCSCIPLRSYVQPDNNCNCNEERIYPTRYEYTLRYTSQAARSLKGGGRYGIGVVGHDRLGRQTFVNNFAYVDVPTFMEAGNYNPWAIEWTAGAGLRFPPETAYVSFYRTRNLNYISYLQWVGDKIEFLNARGETVVSTDEAVRARIYIQSLLDFNRENNFATTVGYQFVQGDMLRIYDNGSEMFPVDADHPFMDYPILGSNFNDTISGADLADPETNEIPGRSFIIAYDKRLGALKDKCSFWIEIIRPHQCVERELYFEICGTYPVQDGLLLNDVKGGVFATWDTYYQNRVIRPVGCAATQINHPFESASITDFWGANCDSSGRVATVNEQARQQWYGDDVIKTDDFSGEGTYNGLGTLRESNRKSFKGQEWGAIVAAHAERSIVCFLCQNDWFLTDFNMNYIRAGENGLVVVNLTNNLSEPHQKTGYTYGCEFEDNATIIFEDGFVLWADRKNANVVVMDYRSAQDLASVDNKSWFLTKFRHVTQHNASLPAQRLTSDLIELCAGYDPKYNEYILTFRPRRGLSASPAAFVNNERETFPEMQETIVFNLDLKKWVRFTGYTPENFGPLRMSRTGKELVAFANGAPYFMNAGQVNYFNYFFGVATDQVVTVVENFDPAKVKIMQSVAVESNAMQYFVDMVFTDMPNSYSYVPMAYWTKREGIWYAAFLRDMSTYPDGQHPVTSMLVDGKRVVGQFAWVRFVRDTRYPTLYNELNNIWFRLSGSDPSET